MQSVINLGFLVNPFLMLALAFFISFVMYGFDWSYLYPELGYNVIGIIILCVAVWITFFYFFKKMHEKLQFIYQENSNVRGIKCVNVDGAMYHRWRLSLVLTLVAICGAYQGGLPILSSFMNFGYRSKEQEVAPLFYPILMGLSNYYLMLYTYMIFTGQRSLYLCAMVVFYMSVPMLFMQRGLVFSGLFAISLLYISVFKYIRVWLILASLVAIVFLSIFFGYMGELRDSGGEYYRDITEMAMANDRFFSLGWDTGIFYVWTYLTSPLANLAMNIQVGSSQIVGGIDGFYYFLLSEIIPDIFSKRISDLELIRDSIIDYRIIDTLNVATMFSRSYSLLGWVGIVLMLLYSVLFFGVCMIVGIRVWFCGVLYHHIFMSQLAAFGFMQIFDNMFSNSARLMPIVITVIVALTRGENRVN